MPRQAQNQAKDTYGQAKRISTTAGDNANGIFGPLLQQYQSEATNPQGIGDVGLNAENTASQQSIGGSIAGAVGQNNQMAARTRNRGGFQIANDESARSGMRQNSTNAVNTIAQNERLKETQRQMGLAGEHGLFDSNLQTELGALNTENGATGQLNQASGPGWFGNMLGLLKTLNPGYSKGDGFSVGS